MNIQFISSDFHFHLLAINLAALEMEVKYEWKRMDTNIRVFALK